MISPPIAVVQTLSNIPDACGTFAEINDASISWMLYLLLLTNDFAAPHIDLPVCFKSSKKSSRTKKHIASFKGTFNLTAA
jgi:hypothetical protein